MEDDRPTERVLDWARPEVWRPWIGAETTAGRPKPGATRRLIERFHALRAFHAARPIDLTSYYRCGIRPLSRARWHELVEECFVSRTEDAGVATAIARARDVQFEMISRGPVHFCCDERLLIERDGYCLIYGGLSLLAVAIRLDKEFGADFKGELRQRGEPAILVCDIPTRLLEDDVLDHLIAALCQADSTGESGTLSSPFDFYFSIDRALPPSAIVGHRHPHHVIDTVYGNHIGNFGSVRAPHAE